MWQELQSHKLPRWNYPEKKFFMDTEEVSGNLVRYHSRTQSYEY